MGRRRLGGWLGLLVLALASPAGAQVTAEPGGVGERLTLVSVRITGASRYAEPALLDVLAVPEGRQVTLQALRDGLGRLAALGIFATLEPRLEAGELGGVLLTVAVQEWPVIRQVRIRGLARTHEEVVRRELAVRPGEQVTRARLEQDMARLGRLGYFSSITPSLEPAGDAHDLVWTLVERNTGKVQASAGWSNVDGPLAALSLQQDNFLGRGQHLGASLSVGRLTDPARRNLSTELSFSEPYLDAARTALGAEAYLRRVYNPLAPLEDGRSGYQDERTGGFFSVGRPLGDPLLATWRWRVSLRGEQVAIARLDASGARQPVGLATLSGQGQDLGFSTGAALEHDSRDDAFKPSRGTRFSLGLEQYLPLTPMRMTRLTLGYSQYGRLPAGLVLAWGYRGGAAFDLPGGRVPFYQRFYGIGDLAVRGWREGELGGSFMSLGSVELRVPVWGPLGGVLFGDAGWFWSPSETTDLLGALRSGYGAGVRIETPMGLLRADYGVPRWGASGTWSIGLGHRF